MTPEELVDQTQKLFFEQAIASDADKFEAYMKNNFKFFGVRSPQRKEIQKEIKHEVKSFSLEDLFTFIDLLWKEKERELHYVAVDMLNYRKKSLSIIHLPKVEKLITTNSWWDTVDGLAPNIAGFIFQKHQDLRMKWIEKWNNSGNMWLNRSAIIHQLRYKEKVDLELLFALIESHIDSKEFFINKASGWALRQASKFHPSVVKEFIVTHKNLSNLTRKEGSKYLDI